MEELLGLAPEKVLLKWMNFHLKKVGYEKQVTNFSSDLKVGKLGNLIILVVAMSILSTEDNSCHGFQCCTNLQFGP